ncbi:hypothetical protein SDC9_199773 [bioreactor metagenome]|uniref:Uncharacterized protein n=1 Tax=bioreactor metagenome TaxID=1076179 RepID=A0A645INZ8_9ZZZZ
MNQASFHTVQFKRVPGLTDGQDIRSFFNTDILAARTQAVIEQADHGGEYDDPAALGDGKADRGASPCPERLVLPVRINADSVPYGGNLKR